MPVSDCKRSKKEKLMVIHYCNPETNLSKSLGRSVNKEYPGSGTTALSVISEVVY